MCGAQIAQMLLTALSFPYFSDVGLHAARVQCTDSTVTQMLLTALSFLYFVDVGLHAERVQCTDDTMAQMSR